MINDYHFGSIRIEHEEYTNDVVVDWQGNVSEWWREEGHVMAPGDIDDVLEKDSEVVVVGTGNSGRMKVTPEVKDRFEEEGVELKVDVTPRAVREFDSIVEEGKRVVGMFHLTC